MLAMAYQALGMLKRVIGSEDNDFEEPAGVITNANTPNEGQTRFKQHIDSVKTASEFKSTAAL